MLAHEPTQMVECASNATSSAVRIEVFRALKLVLFSTIETRENYVSLDFFGDT